MRFHGPFVLLWFVFGVIPAVWIAKHDQGWLIGLLCVGLVSTLRIDILTRSLYSQRAAELSFFPIEDDAIFHRYWAHALRFSLIWIPHTAILYLGMALGARQGPIDEMYVVGALLAAVANDALVISLSAIWTAWFSHWRRVPRMRAAPLIALLGLCIGIGWFGAFVAPAVPWLLLFPTGLVSGAFLAFISPDPSPVPFMIYAGGALIAIAAFPWAFQKLRRDFAIREVEFYGLEPVRAVPADETARDLKTPDEWEAWAHESGAVDTRWLGATVKDRETPSPEFIRTVMQSELEVPSEGILERLILKRLSLRELVVFRLLQPRSWFYDPSGEAMFGGDTWGAQWLKGTREVLLCSLAMMLLPLPGEWKWFAFAPVALVTVVRSPLLGSFWSGMTLTGASLDMVTLPIGYSEIASVVLRVTRARLMVWAPVAIAGCALAGWKTDIGLTAGVILGIKATFVALVMQAAGFVAKMNDGADDRTRFVSAVLWVVLFLSLVAAFVGSISALFLPEIKWTACGAVGLLVTSELILRIDQFRHERGRLDLGGKPSIKEYS